jgi:hypothetical protein
MDGLDNFKMGKNIKTTGDIIIWTLLSVGAACIIISEGYNYYVLKFASYGILLPLGVIGAVFKNILNFNSINDEKIKNDYGGMLMMSLKNIPGLFLALQLMTKGWFMSPKSVGGSMEILQCMAGNEPQEYLVPNMFIMMGLLFQSALFMVFLKNDFQNFKEKNVDPMLSIVYPGFAITAILTFTMIIYQGKLVDLFSTDDICNPKRKINTNVASVPQSDASTTPPAGA